MSKNKRRRRRADPEKYLYRIDARMYALALRMDRKRKVGYIA